jgi:hypothetical protein
LSSSMNSATCRSPTRVDSCCSTWSVPGVSRPRWVSFRPALTLPDPSRSSLAPCSPPSSTLRAAPRWPAAMLDRGCALRRSGWDEETASFSPTKKRRSLIQTATKGVPFPCRLTKDAVSRRTVPLHRWQSAGRNGSRYRRAAITLGGPQVWLRSQHLCTTESEAVIGRAPHGRYRPPRPSARPRWPPRSSQALPV